MTIPKVVKAGGMEYKVSFIPSSQIDNGRACGETNHRLGTIKIAAPEEYCRQQQELIFLHELFHIAYDKAGLTARFAPEVEEQMVEALSSGIYDILKQNNMLK